MAFKKEWESQHPFGYFEHRFAFGPNGKYGNWIVRRNSAVRIDDTLFMHGGISPKYISREIDEINQIRSDLADLGSARSNQISQIKRDGSEQKSRLHHH